MRLQGPVRLVAVVAVVLAVACSTSDDELVAGDGPPPAASDTAGEAPPPLAPSAVSLWVSAERVPPGPVEVVGILVNHTGADVTFGLPAAVDRWDGATWVPHRQLVMCQETCTAPMAPVNEVLGTDDIGLVPTLEQPGPVERFTTDGLDTGWYRITQTANDGTVAAGVIEVAEDAPPPAPLVATDAPAISVSPALVNGGGGAVTLSPLIPSPTGTRSIDDIEAAVAGLSTRASIERWDGAAWDTVADVELQGPGLSASSTEVSAHLPALDPGAYRMVRTGPEGSHPGSFWVMPDDQPETPPVEPDPTEPVATEPPGAAPTTEADVDQAGDIEAPFFDPEAIRSSLSERFPNSFAGLHYDGSGVLVVRAVAPEFEAIDEAVRHLTGLAAAAPDQVARFVRTEPARFSFRALDQAFADLRALGLRDQSFLDRLGVVSFGVDESTNSLQVGVEDNDLDTARTEIAAALGVEDALVTVIADEVSVAGPG